MLKSCLGAIAAAGLLAGPSAALADNLTGADKILCTAVQATVCTLEGGCEMGSPWDFNVPQFIEIDFTVKTLSTTKASGQNRTSPFKNFQREDGKVFLQGVEKGRAFSFVIEEASGDMSVAVAREGLTVSVFGACTPITGSK
jgi:hypothetical protein